MNKVSVSRYIPLLMGLSIFIFVIMAIINCVFAFLTMDDFFFLNHTNYHNVFVVVGEFTKNWMGRPVSTLLIAAPSFFSSYPQYIILRIFLILPFLITIAAFGLLSMHKSIFNPYRFIMYAVLGSGLFYSGIPDLSSFLYWSSAAHTYHSGLAFLALGSSILIIKERACFISGALLILSIGCVQLNFILVPLVYIALTYIYKLKINRVWCIVFALIIITVLFLFFYPEGRQSNEFNPSIQNLKRLVYNLPVIILPSFLFVLMMLTYFGFKVSVKYLAVSIIIFMSTYLAFGITSTAPLSGRLTSYFEVQLILLIVLMCGPFLFDKIPVLICIVISLIQTINPQVHYLYTDIMTGSNQAFSQSRVQEEQDLKNLRKNEVCPKNTKTHTLIMSLSDDYFKSNYARYYNVKIDPECVFPSGRE